MNEVTNIDLNEFAEGALAERLNQEIQRVLENIANPNTDAKKARKVTATLTFKPTTNRGLATVLVDVKSTTLPSVGVETEMIIDYSTGKVVGAELKSGVPGQTYFDGESIKTDKGEVVEQLEEKSDTKKVVQFK